MPDASITARLAAFVSDPPASAASRRVRESARLSLLDTFAVTLAGVDEPAAVITRDVLGVGSNGDATVIGTRHRAGVLDAAECNGTAAHALDYDDTLSSVKGHPSAPVVAAALATAESMGATGATLLAAIAVGIEVAGKVGRSLGASHAEIGFHSTATLGALGAAAAASHVARLDPARTAVAMGIAASGAAGLRANFGTMTKPLQVGRAARGGVEAACLAAAGLTASPTIFDGRGSFTATFSPTGDGDPTAIARFGEPWEIVDPGLAVKQYPCCNRGSRAIDAAIEIAHRDRPDADSIETVEIHVAESESDAAGRIGPMTYVEPSDGLEAKFSMQYTVAAALLDGAVTIGTFSDDQVERAEVRRLMTRIRLVNDAGRRIDDPDSNYHRVVVRVASGDRYEATVRVPRGNPRSDAPASWASVAAKFADCARGVLTGARIERALAEIEQIDTAPCVGELLAHLTPTNAGATT